MAGLRLPGVAASFVLGGPIQRNSIESVFLKPETLLREVAERTVEEIWRAIGRPIDAITPAECANLAMGAGYDTTRSENARYRLSFSIAYRSGESETRVSSRLVTLAPRLERFARAVRGVGTPAVTGAQGAANDAVLDAIVGSALAGGRAREVDHGPFDAERAAVVRRSRGATSASTLG